MVLHPDAPGRVYAADGLGFDFPGRGYYESTDGGETWKTPKGLEHQYLWGLSIDTGDPDRILVSAAASPQAAHLPEVSESYIYRRESNGTWAQRAAGSPALMEICIPVFETNEAESSVFYALTDGGIYRSANRGVTWTQLDIKLEAPADLPGRRGPTVGPTGLLIVQW